MRPMCPTNSNNPYWTLAFCSYCSTGTCAYGLDATPLPYHPNAHRAGMTENQRPMDGSWYWKEQGYTAEQFLFEQCSLRPCSNAACRGNNGFVRGVAPDKSRRWRCCTCKLLNRVGAPFCENQFCPDSEEPAAASRNSAPSSPDVEVREVHGDRTQLPDDVANAWHGTVSSAASASDAPPRQNRKPDPKWGKGSAWTGRVEPMRLALPPRTHNHRPRP